MSYEYSAASGRFEIGNPYKVENLALFAAGAAAVLVGIALLILYRTALGSTNATGIKAVAVGLVSLGLGVAVLGTALAQLRYFFGRGRPHNLYSPEETLAAKRAQWLKDNLRQNSLAYREPQGAIDGLVHHIFDTLIFAPEQIRRAAEAQCSNLLLTGAILLGMRGRPDMAQFYADHLENFARNISSVIAPSSTADADRITRISQVQQQLGVPIHPLAQPAAAPTMLTAARESPAATNRACSNPGCSRELSRDAMFCAFCGTRVAG